MKKEKISLAVALMTEILRNQKPVVINETPSWLLPVDRYGKDSQCGEHENCSVVREQYFILLSKKHPNCIARGYLKGSARYFVIYAEFSPLSKQLGRGRTECLAWEKAIESLKA